MLHSQVHIDGFLARFAVEYKNTRFIAREVMPVVPVAKKSDKYPVFNKKDRFTLPETIRGPKDPANMIETNLSSDNYSCVDHALKDFLPDALIANADVPVDVRRKTLEALVDLILLRHEYAAAALAFGATNYGASQKVTLSGNDQLDQYTTSDPMGVIDTALGACFVPANTLIMGKEVYDKLKRHPQLLDHVKGGATTGDPAKVTAAQMAELFEVDRILVGTARRNTANKGQTASLSHVWGKYICAAYIDPNPQLMGLSAFKTFLWTQMAGGEGYKVRTWRDEDKGGGGEVIEVETSYDQKFVASDCAYLISGAIS